MSEIFVPGVRSRFNTDQIIEDLMTIERIPRDRTQNRIDDLQAQRGHWNILGTRIESLRESARFLFSFQNPFNERISQSSDERALTATATREASEQSFSFAVIQTASADRFLSQPLDERTRIEAGTYTFTLGDDEISINFRGGTLREFVDVVNRRGRDRIGASLIAVQPGTRSLIIESRETGAAARLGFADAARDLAINVGMAEAVNDTHIQIPLNENAIRAGAAISANNQNISVREGVVQVPPQASASVPMNLSVSADSPLVLRLNTQTRINAGENVPVPAPPPGPSVNAGSVTFGGITIQNQPSSAPLPEWQPPPAPVRVDNLSVLALTFSDGSSVRLPAISDTYNFTSREYNLAGIAQGRTITGLSIENNNTHREVSVSNIEILDPNAIGGGLRPINAVASARDAIIVMEGIEITRPSNNIDDLIPGVTLNVRGVSDRPVDLTIRADVESVKDAIISFVGNYNRLMAELNVLTRRDERIIDELTYLTPDEAAAKRERLGVFASDSTLVSLRNNLLRTVTAPYPTHMERELAMLAQIGISTNALGSTGFDASRLRGYLQINERELDTALENNITAIRELFASDTDGNLLSDTGVAFNVDALVSPFVGIGGIVSLRTSSIDARINQDERRIATLDRQLAAREQDLRIQYGRMEAAFSRMEQMTNSLDNFNRANHGGR